ncbi:pyrroline-5-carboxylate reductase [Alkalicoccus halolimnae]|uniref:Pyrroline-5-carboxylate reductase n=1 Tax=Alkalicoccus halolimnae TaxID=1667239 RepID=A0A5C7FJ70_9BACI|nr:pyrroline-5-carboxylate reductase [Alkalicoccus halolimnae]TXF86334.1 pyrroline-5-carboxylate reductase [Alkalicoccus halolimnae]
MKVTIIGGGSMAEALIAGWTAQEYIRPGDIYVTNRSNDIRLAELARLYSIKTSRDTHELINNTDFLILSCKPKDWMEALKPYLPYLHNETVIISVMAGVTTASMQKAAPNSPVIRSMPNTSAAVCASMTSLAFGPGVSEEHISKTEFLFRGVGETAVIEESMMDAVTALTGTGPAYIYYLMESMEKAAANIGVPEHIGRELVAQTLIGASRRVQKEEATPSDLYMQIMSPGGTTEAGFNVLKERGVQEALIDCIAKAYERSQELGKNPSPPEV